MIQNTDLIRSQEIELIFLNELWDEKSEPQIAIEITRTEGNSICQILKYLEIIELQHCINPTFYLD